MKIEEVSLETIVATIELIPEFETKPSLNAIKERCADVPHLCLGAIVDDQIVGFKLGYQKDEQTFYSWMGGVLPTHRRIGVASALLKTQEAWSWEKNYQKLVVKSLNCYPAMLHLLIKNEYVIAGTTGTSQTDIKIRFEKINPKPEEFAPEWEHVEGKTPKQEDGLEVIGADILGTRLGRIRDLEGFAKGHHKIPDTCDQRTQRFVEAISEKDIERESTELFQQLRKSIGYKRKEISLERDGPSGKITTKDFELFISYSQSEEFPSNFQIEYRISNISNPVALETSELDTIFNHHFDEARFRLKGIPDIEAMIDAFEASNIDTMDLVYPPNCSELQLSAQTEDWVLSVSPQGVSIKHESSGPPDRLLKVIESSQEIFSNHSVFASMLKLR